MGVRQTGTVGVLVAVVREVLVDIDQQLDAVLLVGRQDHKVSVRGWYGGGYCYYCCG